MSSDTIPVILCGKLPAIAGPVIDALKPQVEVIDVVHSVEIGRSHLPTLLKGNNADNTISKPLSELGTHDFSKTPLAVLTGGGYATEEVEQLREVARTVRPIMFLHMGPSPPGTLAPGEKRPDASTPWPGPKPNPDFVVKLAKRMVDTLHAQRDAEGGLGRDEVVLY